MKSSSPGYENSLFRDHGPDLLDGSDMERREMKLFSLQDKVQRLPIPPLEHTLNLFIKSVAPHVSEEEYAETIRKVEAFRASGLAEKLQNRILALKDSRPNSSWFISMWNDVAYLGYRDSVVYNVTYYLQFSDEIPAAMRSSSRRAARIVSHALEFKDLVSTGNLAPDMRSANVPMSNSQYKYMFNTTRIPGKERDFVRTYAPDVFNHIIVARRNRFYSLQTTDSTGKRLSVDELQAQLDRIKSLAQQRSVEHYPAGILTADNRDGWYINRQLLLHGLDERDCAKNQRALQLIESASFVLCLDETLPVTREETGHALLHADGRNRFWDKSLQFIVFDNGKAGFAGEHSMMDGTTSCRLINHVLDRLFVTDDDITKIGGSSVDIRSASCLLPEPQGIEFALDSRLRKSISDVGLTFDNEMATKDLSVVLFRGYGKNQIKRWKVSPDAFAQLAIQYAYFKTFLTTRGTYESTQTRTFLHGRTEVTRSATSESKQFCESMIYGSDSSSELHLKLVAATRAHVNFSIKASQGVGCDRHLLGLKMMMREGESAEIFSDVGFLRSGTWALSTSGLVGEFMDGWGFGEVVPHGVGIGYSVQNEKIRFTVTSRNGWAHRLTANLEAALVEMGDLCEKESRTPQSKL